MLPELSILGSGAQPSRSAQSAIDLPFVLAHGFIEAPKDSTFAYRPKLQNQEPALSLR